MMPVETHWTAYVQAFGTPLVALIAGGIASMIAYRQWQTAKEKVVLDLFEKRLEAYNYVSDSIHRLNQVGAANIDHEIIGPFAVGLKQSKFLFGQEINSYLDHIFVVIHKLKSNSRRQREEFQRDIKKFLEEEDRLELEISGFHDKLDILVAPYMLMDAKLSQPRIFRRILVRVFALNQNRNRRL